MAKARENNAAAAGATPKTKAWTVAVYMAADGPSGSQALDGVAISDLADIARAAKPHGAEKGKSPVDHMHVAVQVDLLKTDGLLRLVVTDDKDLSVGVDSAPGAQTAEAFGRRTELIREANTASVEGLKSFLKWVVDRCPAEHYLVIFWGHSSGPVGLFGDQTKVNGAITRLTLPNLKQVFEDRAVAEHFQIAKTKDRTASGRPAPAENELPIDIVLFKDCWMSTLE